MAPKKRLRNDPDTRIGRAVIDSRVGVFPDRDLAKLDRPSLPCLIGELRQAETEVRRLRKRLEALHNQVDRPCPQCGRAVAGRADAVYCSTDCRVKAHRRRARADGD